MIPTVTLANVIREDVERISGWLQDQEINTPWYGTDESGDPLHIGYLPRQMVEATSGEAEAVFTREDRRIFSVLSAGGNHIGEAQLVIDTPLKESQLFVLIGRKDLWYQGFGTAAMLELLDLAFGAQNMHRSWVVIPEYNLPAPHMCERIGFILEGHLRSTQRKDGVWYDSLTLGLLSDEYARRRARLSAKQEEVPPWYENNKSLVDNEFGLRFERLRREAEPLSSWFSADR